MKDKSLAAGQKEGGKVVGQHAEAMLKQAYQIRLPILIGPQLSDRILGFDPIHPQLVETSKQT